jgi:hypothetical protein
VRAWKYPPERNIGRGRASHPGHDLEVLVPRMGDEWHILEMEYPRDKIDGEAAAADVNKLVLPSQNKQRRLALDADRPR